MGKEVFWGKKETVYVKQVIFAYGINSYRRKHNLSQAEFAEICNICSEGRVGKFSNWDICKYENMKKTPRKNRFQIISKIIDE